MYAKLLCLVFTVVLLVSCTPKKPAGVEGAVKHFRFDPVPSPMPSKSAGAK